MMVMGSTKTLLLPAVTRYPSTMTQSACHRTRSTPPSALLALINDTEQRAVEQVLHQEGYHVAACPTERDLVTHAKEAVPDLLFIDADRPGTDLGSLVRILSRFHGTRATAIILVVPAGSDRARYERLQAISPFAILTRPLTCALLCQTATAAQEHVNHQKTELGLVANQPASTTRHAPDNNSLLIHQVTCAFHDEPVTLDRYVLRAGRIETELNFFDIPVYTAATRGADFVDYNLLGVTVCPQCLFASNDPAHFDDPAERSVKPVEYNQQTRSVIRGRIDVRRSIASGHSADFFTHKRTAQQAVIAFELAIDCSTAMYGCNKYSMPIELLRLANYHLRLMHLREKMGATAQQIDAHATAALDWLKQGFLLLEGPALYKTIYQLVALSIWMHEDRAAHQYLSRLVELSRLPDLPRDHKGLIDRYETRCKTAWEDRDLHRSPIARPPDGDAAAEAA